MSGFKIKLKFSYRPILKIWTVLSVERHKSEERDQTNVIAVSGNDLSIWLACML